MIFHINNNVLYDEEENTLAHIDNAANKIVLLRPSARLLSLFIRNNNVLLMREKLLNEVWVEHGLKASNNNLNNYVSGLRKSLAQFGEEKIIVTFPRQGFKFTAESIHVENENKRSIKNEYEADDTKEARRSGFFRRKIAWLLLRRSVATMLICLLLFTAFMVYKHSMHINVYPLGNYASCQLYSMKAGGGDKVKVIEFIQRESLNCASKADVYYYDRVEQEGIKDGAGLVTFCPRTANTPCFSKPIDND
ncbi:hypothetical protein SME05J_44800 [Serratia marcescens]|jgi:DNA-binding winged helix-turn-helix (wHTH) protein|nr:hypothetical protein SME05J_44800 [Serratia marcescens]